MPTLPTPVQTADIEVNPPVENTLLGSYSYASSRLQRLIGSWSQEKEATDYRRRQRNIAVNVPELRQKGVLKPDETFIPVRVIDTNIRRSQPPKIAFVKQSHRMAIFKSVDQPGRNVERLESEFTRVLRYPGWEKDFFRLIDGGDTHGWDFLEVIYDTEKEGKVSFEQISHDQLIFSLDSEDIENNELVARTREVTISTLRRFVHTYGFSEEQVNLVIQAAKDDLGHKASNRETDDVTLEDSKRTIYKVWMKAGIDGCVYVAWFSPLCNDWLKAPEKLFMGVRNKEVKIVETESFDEVTGLPIQGQDTEDHWVDAEEYEYPLVPYFHEESEEREIKSKKGRVFKDDYKQEAACALWSSFVNGCLRASNIHGAPKNGSTGAAPKQTSVLIEHGKMWNEPIDFFNTPWPDPMILQGLESLEAQNTHETNQINYAIRSNLSTRKTAKEVESSNQDQSLMSGVTVTMFSITVRMACIKAWRIVQSQALQELISFAVVERDRDQITGEVIYGNDLELIAGKFEISAAGETDVVERQNKLQRQMQYWPLYSQTPIAQEFLIDLTKNAFPDESDKYERILREGMMADKQLIQQLVQVLGKVVLDESGENLKPEFADVAQELQALFQQAGAKLQQAV